MAGSVSSFFFCFPPVTLSSKAARYRQHGGTPHTTNHPPKKQILPSAQPDPPEDTTEVWASPLHFHSATTPAVKRHTRGAGGWQGVRNPPARTTATGTSPTAPPGARTPRKPPLPLGRPARRRLPPRGWARTSTPRSPPSQAGLWREQVRGRPPARNTPAGVRGRGGREQSSLQQPGDARLLFT